ncbi:MAG: methyltransferase domain-containing protein [Myxococcota bacterium]
MLALSGPSGNYVPAWDLGRPSPVVLRLLPFVHHPPAKVLVTTCGAAHEARALDARGYTVTCTDLPGRVVPAGVAFVEADFVASDFAGAFDLVCEHGGFSLVPPSERGRWVSAAHRALRPGGKLFGAFLTGDDGDRPVAPWGIRPSELLALVSDRFEVERVEKSPFTHPLGAPQLEVVLTRR